MKAFFCSLSLLCIFFPSLSLAYSYENLLFKITIKNNTPETCVLSHIRILHGSSNHLMPIPEKIQSGSEKSIFIGQDLTCKASILLSYLCGGLRSISFLSTRDSGGSAVWQGQDIISGQIISAIDMDSIFDIHHGTLMGGVFESYPGEITWILS